MIPVKLVLENFISHIYSILDFTQFDVALITGSFEGDPNIANGVGKCLPGYTKVCDYDSGDLIPIEEFVKRKSSKTLGLVKNKIKPVSVKNWFCLGTKKIVSVKLKNGSIIKMADTHPILTNRGCIRAKDLNLGDWIAETRCLPFMGKYTLSDEESILLGLLIGDGHIKDNLIFTNKYKHNIFVFSKLIKSIVPGARVKSYNGKNHIIVSDKKVQREYVYKLKKLFIENNINFNKYSKSAYKFYKHNSRISLKNLEKIEKDCELDLSEFKMNFYPREFFRKWLNSFDLLGTTSGTKRIPEKIISSSLTAVSNILSGLWMSDGYVSTTLNGHVEVSYCSKNYDLINDIKILLLRLGIISYITNKTVCGGSYFNLNILVSSVPIFMEKINLWGYKRDRLGCLVKLIEGRSRNENIDLIPANFNKNLNLKSISGKRRTLKQLQKNCFSRHAYLDFGGNNLIGESDIFWSRIDDISDHGEELCYDIEVDTPEHLYIADNMIVHNSSIMDGIRFALYGKGKFSTKTKMIRRGTESCRVEFEFISDGESYRIIRKLSAKSGIMILELSQKIGDEWESEGWTCDTPTKTNQKVIDIVGMNHDTFVNIVYFRQNDVSGFTSATVSKRKEILKEALQIGIWDEFQKVSKGTEKYLSSRLGSINDRLKLLGDVKSEIKEANLKIKQKSNEVKELQKEMSDVEGILGESEDEISHLELTIAKDNVLDKDTIESEMTGISKRSKEISERKNILKEYVKKNNEIFCNADNDCKSLGKVLLGYYKDVLQVSHRNRDGIANEYRIATKKKVPTPKHSKSSMQTTKDKWGTCSVNIQTIESDLSKLNALEPGKECPTCLEEIDNIKAVEKRRKARRKFLENRLLEEKVLFGEICEEFDKINKAIARADVAAVEIERTNFIIAKRMAGMTDAEKDNQRIQSELKSLAAEWNNLKDRKVVLAKLLNKKETKNKQNLKKLVKSRQEVVHRLDTLREEAVKFSVVQGNLTGFREELERRNSEVQALNNEKNKISSSMAIYSKLSTAFGKDGIQAIIMENITEDLRQYANTILRNIYYKPMGIDFVTQRQTSTGTWKEDFDIIINIDNELYDFEDISGGEQVRVSIALRLALSQLLMRRVGSNVRFLLFDEVDQALDKHGLEALSDAIVELSKEFKILVISHNDYMKERFEHIITVHMGPTGSVLR